HQEDVVGVGPLQGVGEAGQRSRPRVPVGPRLDTLPLRAQDDHPIAHLRQGVADAIQHGAAADHHGCLVPAHAGARAPGQDRTQDRHDLMASGIAPRHASARAATETLSSPIRRESPPMTPILRPRAGGSQPGVTTATQRRVASPNSSAVPSSSMVAPTPEAMQISAIVTASPPSETSWRTGATWASLTASSITARPTSGSAAVGLPPAGPWRRSRWDPAKLSVGSGPISQISIPGSARPSRGGRAGIGSARPRTPTTGVGLMSAPSVSL